MATVNYNITFIRGDTYYSPAWQFFNQAIPADITQDELEQGITDGTYVPWDLSAYTITGHVRRSYTDDIVINLPIDKNNNRISFKLSPSVTEPFMNVGTSLIYDIQFKTNDTGDVKTMIAGNLSVTPDVTYS